MWNSTQGLSKTEKMGQWYRQQKRLQLFKGNLLLKKALKVRRNWLKYFINKNKSLAQLPIITRERIIDFILIKDGITNLYPNPN